MTVILAASLVSLSLAPAAAPAGSVIRVGKGANGKTITLHRGDRLVVSLATNPSTGFDWRLLRLNKSLVKPAGTRYVADQPILTGSGGVDILAFRAAAPGTTRLKLVYARPWLAADPTAQTFVLTLVVKR